MFRLNIMEINMWVIDPIVLCNNIKEDDFF